MDPPRDPGRLSDKPAAHPPTKSREPERPKTAAQKRQDDVLRSMASVAAPEDLMKPLPRNRNTTYVVLALVGASMVALVVGAILRLTNDQTPLLEWGGILAIGLAIGLGWSIDFVPWLRRGTVDTRVSDIRNWQALKVMAVFLNLLMLLAIIFMAIVILGRAGVYDVLETDMIARVATSLAVVIGIVTSIVFVQAMRNDLELDRSMGVAVAHVATLMFAFGSASYAIVSGTASDTASLALLLAWSLVAIDVFLTRSVPNLYTLVADHNETYRGHTHFNKSKAVWFPLAVGFGLLCLMFIVILLAGSGAERAASVAQANPVTFAIVLGVAVVAIVTIVLAGRLARQEDKPELYQQSVRIEEQRARSLLVVSITLGTVAAVAAGLVMAGAGGVVSKSWWVDILAAGLLLSLGPYGFYMAYESRRVRSLEDRFPDFLRDIAASHRGGLTLGASVTVAARGDYGSLSPYVQRMADQMTWNVPFAQSLEWMADQLRTPLVRRAVELVLEADRSGGGTADVLYAASRDAREIKKMEVDRRIAMSLYTIVIHITFGVFLLVSAVLFAQFVPQIVEVSQLQNELGGSVESPVGQGTGNAEVADYRAFYYLAALVQAVGGGLVAGLMATGRAKLGLQHSFAMIAFSFIVFSVMLA